MKETEATVFIVDDDAHMRESLRNLVRSVGLRAELFASAQEFLQSRHSNAPSCLVLDVRMPREPFCRAAEGGVENQRC